MGQGWSWQMTQEQTATDRKSPSQEWTWRNGLKKVTDCAWQKVEVRMQGKVHICSIPTCPRISVCHGGEEGFKGKRQVFLTKDWFLCSGPFLSKRWAFPAGERVRARDGKQKVFVGFIKSLRNGESRWAMTALLRDLEMSKETGLTSRESQLEGRKAEWWHWVHVKRLPPATDWEKWNSGDPTEDSSL